jgi:hypothetical protein
MTDLRTAALRALDALGAARDTTYSETLYVQFELAISTLKAALAQPEDKSQAAFEHWVETVEATQGCAISRNAVADAAPIIKLEIKGHTWHGLTDEERDYFRACGFVGVSRVEELLRAKNT